MHSALRRRLDPPDEQELLEQQQRAALDAATLRKLEQLTKLELNYLWNLMAPGALDAISHLTALKVGHQQLLTLAELLISSGNALCCSRRAPRQAPRVGSALRAGKTA
jgi:hypothetical protein